MRIRYVAGAVLLLALVAGCPPQQQSGGTTGTSGTGQAAARLAVAGGIISLPLEVAADDPGLKQLDFSDPRLFALARCVGMPLVRSSADGRLQSGLASTWEILENGQRWRFTLQDGHNEPAQPSALGEMWIKHVKTVLRSEPGPLQAQLADLIAGAADFRDGKSLEISGINHTTTDLEIQLTRPNNAFGLWLSQPGLSILASHQIPTAGYGPFRLAQFEGSMIVLKANTDSLAGQPLLSELHFICEPDRSKQLELYRGGQLDAANLLPADVPGILSDPELSSAVQKHASAEMILGYFDLHEFPWGDGEFQSKLGLRQAANWGLGREDLETGQNQQFTAWPHALPKCFERYLNQQYVQQPPYPLHEEIELARQGLINADHDQGIKLPIGMDLMYLRDEHLGNLATDIVQFLEAISLKLRTFEATPAELAKRLELQTNEIILARVRPHYPDVDALLYPTLHSALFGAGGNWAMLQDEQIDRGLEAGQAEADSTARQVIYRQLTTELEDRALLVFVGYASPTLLISPRLAGYTLSPFDFDASLAAQDFTRIGLAD